MTIEDSLRKLHEEIIDLKGLVKSLTNTSPGVDHTQADDAVFGNFEWYLNLTGLPISTARQQIARGDVPGIRKLGRRLLFNKAIVRNWIETKQRPGSRDREAEAEKAFAQNHSGKCRGGRAAV